jgi:hypothetical protein
MNTEYHDFSVLFSQLSLPNDSEAIEEFIKSHSPLDNDILLEEAPFWNTAQAQFIREARIADSDWTEVVDSLDAALRREY